MPTRTTSLCWLALAAALGLAGCATAPPPPPVAVPQAQHSRPQLDWFRRTLADARRARAAHLKAGDKPGASRAYASLMVPACERVEQQGPAKYLARCRAILHPAAKAPPAAMSASAATSPARHLPAVQSATPAPAEDTVCDPDRDDSNDTPAQITACSD